MKSDFHKTVGEKMAVRNEKGEPYRETYGPEHFTVNCPSDTLWRDYLLDTAEFCVKAYGCDGIYLDQLASAEPFACYCAEHSHEISVNSTTAMCMCCASCCAVCESTTPMRIS